MAGIMVILISYYEEKRSDTMSENEKIILAIIVIAYIYSRMD